MAYSVLLSRVSDTGSDTISAGSPLPAQYNIGMTQLELAARQAELGLEWQEALDCARAVLGEVCA